MARGEKVSEEERKLSALLKAAIAYEQRTAPKVEKPNLTITALAKRIDESYDRLSNMLNGRTAVEDDVLVKLRMELKKPAGWPLTMMQRSSQSAANKEGQLVSLAGTPLAAVPVIGKIEAGPGAHNVDVPLGEVWVPETLARTAGYGWEVEGDSMMPDLEPGDVLLFAERHKPKRGFPMLLRSADREDRVKILEWMDGEWVMTSRNLNYPPEPLRDTQILGILVGFYRYSGRREIILSDPDGLSLPLFE